MSSKVFIGKGALRAGAWTRVIGKGSAVVLVSEPRAFRLFGRQAKAALSKAGLEHFTHLLPAGEAAKTWPEVAKLMSAMLARRCDRRCVVAALGGGAVTDAAGFAASIYMRGVRWISLPTTLLGQLDGGLGGKTAINLPQGKNLAGAFHQPAAVVCDVDTLATLERRDIVSGLGEALKYGLVFDPPLWNELVGKWDALAGGDTAALEKVVLRGARWKLSVVAEDEREAGRRELLNFGHTLGHALENAAGYGVLRHGEAVIWGMRAALELSRRRAGFPAAKARELDVFLAGRVKITLRGLRPGAILEAARGDKKARGKTLRFVLLKDVGRPVAGRTVPDKEALEVIRSLL